MSEAIVGTGPLYTTGLGPCYAIGLYGTTTSGVAQLLLCHADSTMGGGDGETTVRECQQQFGEVEEGSLKIVVISGSSLTTQYRQAATIADIAFETPAPPGPVEGWNAEVCLMPDGQVNWATFSFDQQAERDRLQNQGYRAGICSPGGRGSAGYPRPLLPAADGVSAAIYVPKWWEADRQLTGGGGRIAAV